MAAAPRLENVLKRAEELEAMEKAPAALDALYETVLSKRTRAMALEQLEPVFAKFIQLAVQLRRGKVVKDGLHQYKKLVISAGDEGVAALETAVNNLLQQAEDAVAHAQQQAEEVKVDDDLEEESPQDLLLAMVSSEEAKDRTDREMVTPWLKFLWESFRSVLDVLRNNSKLETAYAKVASSAFSFCLKFGRKTEFRRLCELLRTHLQYAAAQSRAYHKEISAARQRAIEQADTNYVTPAQVARQLPPTFPQNPVDLSDADTLQRFLDTRFEQLDVAVKLELWQEAFRSVEDVHTLLTATRRPIPMASMATYYETLARVFAVSQNHLFHAATYFRYFVMLVSRRAPEEELQRVASLTVLGLLCVPRGDNNVAPASGRARRWMALINLQRCPTRESLIEAALSRSFLNFAKPELRELFNLFEHGFNPLTFHESLNELAPFFAANEEFKDFARPLLEVAATTVFDELATTYSEAKLEFVLGLVDLPAPFNAPRADLERLLVRGSAAQPQGGAYRVRIDHQQGIVRFVDSLSYPLEGTAGAMVRTELYDFASQLAQTPFGVAVVPEAAKRTPQQVSACITAENSAYLARRQREEEREREEKKERDQSEKARVLERTRIAQEARAAAEQHAVQEELARRTAQYEKQVAEVELAEKRKLAESINAKGHVRVDMDKLEELSKDQLNMMQVEQLDHEAKSLTARMEATSRRYDHLERALRREEAKLWTVDASQQRVRDEEQHSKRKEALVTGARRQHELAQQYSQRFARAQDAYNTFVANLRSAHEARIADLRTKNSKLLEDAKAKRLAEHAEKIRIAEEKLKAEEERRAAEAKAAEERRVAQEERRKTTYQPPVSRAAAATAGTAPSGTPGAYRPPAAGAYRPPAAASSPLATSTATASAPTGAYRPPTAGGSYRPPVAAAGGAYRPPASRPAGNPFGRTAGNPVVVNKDAPNENAPKTEAPKEAPGPKRFVPPHLRK